LTLKLTTCTPNWNIYLEIYLNFISDWNNAIRLFVWPTICAAETDGGVSSLSTIRQFYGHVPFCCLPGNYKTK